MWVEIEELVENIPELRVHDLAGALISLNEEVKGEGSGGARTEKEVKRLRLRTAA